MSTVLLLRNTHSADCHILIIHIENYSPPGFWYVLLLMEWFVLLIESVPVLQLSGLQPAQIL